jgi:hypothetical protein
MYRVPEFRQRFSSSQFADTDASQQSTDLEIVQKGRNPVMWSFLPLIVLGSIAHGSHEPFAFDVIGYFSNPMYQKVKGLSR